MLFVLSCPTTHGHQIATELYLYHIERHTELILYSATMYPVGRIKSEKPVTYTTDDLYRIYGGADPDDDKYVFKLPNITIYTTALGRTYEVFAIGVDRSRITIPA